MQSGQSQIAPIEELKINNSKKAIQSSLQPFRASSMHLLKSFGLLCVATLAIGATSAFGTVSSEDLPAYDSLYPPPSAYEDKETSAGVARPTYRETDLNSEIPKESPWAYVPSYLPRRAPIETKDVMRKSIYVLLMHLFVKAIVKFLPKMEPGMLDAITHIANVGIIFVQCIIFSVLYTNSHEQELVGRLLQRVLGLDDSEIPKPLGAKNSLPIRVAMNTSISWLLKFFTTRFLKNMDRKSLLNIQVGALKTLV